VIYLARKTFNISGDKILISGADHHYLFNVKRVEKAEKVVFYTPYTEYHTSPILINKRNSEFKIEKKIYCDVPCPLIYLVLPMADFSAIEMSLKNAVETGVNEIILWRSERSNSKKATFERRKERLLTIIDSAVTQSRARHIPSLKIMDYCEIINREGDHFFMHPYSESNVFNGLNKNNDHYIWIGPEGGFTDNEIKKFCDDGVSSFALNLPIMRMETAVSVGIAIFSNTIRLP